MRLAPAENGDAGFPGKYPARLSGQRSFRQAVAPVICRQNILALGIAGEKTHTADELIGVGIIRHAEDAGPIP